MKGQVIADIKIIPVGTANPGLSQYIAACLDKVKGAPEVIYELTAMGTIIQGSLEQVLDLARQMHEVPFQKGAQRAVTTIIIDDRRDKPGTIEQKVQAVLSKAADK
ncbi:MTH1187 family thiamine-binding protein [Chloroflexota bacterium]